MVGTVASLSAVVGEQGWSVEAAFIGVAGIGLTFCMWWTYFLLPQADILHARRERFGRFGYLHMVVFASIVATGAGLHTAAYYIRQQSALGSVATVLSVAIPVGIYILMIYLLYAVMTHTIPPFHVLLLAGSVVVLGLAVLLAASGVSMSSCLLVVTLAPVVSILGYEVHGHRHAAQALRDLHSDT